MTAPTSIQNLTTVPVTGAGEEFCPVRMMDVELTEPLPIVDYDGHQQRIWVLARLHTEPIGTCVMDLGLEGLTSDQFGAKLWLEFREVIIEHFAAAGLPGPSGLPASGLEADPARWPFLRDRLAVLAAAPFISVVICTRDRVDQLDNCLRFLECQQYPQFEVVVVEQRSDQ